MEGGVEYGCEMRQGGEGVGVVFEEVAEVVEGKGDAFDEVGFALVQAAETVGAKGLEYAHKEVETEVPEPDSALVAGYVTDVEVVAEEFVAQGLRKVAFGAVEERCDIILCSTAPTALKVDVE